MKPAIPLAAALAALSAPALAGEATTVPVAALAAAPAVDGDVADWPQDAWRKIHIEPADDKVEFKAVGAIEVEIAAGVHGGTFYLAARWPDETPDVEHRPWRWNGAAYKRSDERDDMFAARFHMDGQFDTCMITDKAYGVDVWLWSAGRSDLYGQAEDMAHRITTDLTESAAEYKLPGGATVYISKSKDEGKSGWRTVRAGKELTTETVPSVQVVGPATGSLGDVGAKGVWRDGFWHLELARKRDTGHGDDVRLGAGAVTGQIAVFNRSQSENKSVSGPLVFAFP